MAQIVLDRVDKTFAHGVQAVHDLSLEIPDGEFMVLVGPSGCGKSTALRIIAGLEDITRGTLQIGDRIVNNLSPKDRDIAMIFQNYALYPQMTVAQNMAFGLQMRKTPKREIARRVQDAAKILGLEPYLARKPAALSGGQRQRVAMGRAIVREPQAFLMDEPLSNLDAKLRVGMRASLAELHERLHVTTVYVTHDQVEAMTLGQRVCVLRDGMLQQVDTPQNLYDHPVNLFVGGFIGSPSMNLVTAKMISDDDGAAVTFAGHRLAVPESVVHANPEIKAYFGRDVILGIRPSDFEDASLTEQLLAEDTCRNPRDRSARQRDPRDLFHRRAARRPQGRRRPWPARGGRRIGDPASRRQVPVDGAGQRAQQCPRRRPDRARGGYQQHALLRPRQRARDRRQENSGRRRQASSRAETLRTRLPPSWPHSPAVAGQ